MSERDYRRNYSRQMSKINWTVVALLWLDVAVVAIGGPPFLWVLSSLALMALATASVAIHVSEMRRLRLKNRRPRLCKARCVQPVGSDGLIVLAFDVQGSSEVIRVALPWRDARWCLEPMQEYLAPNPQDPEGAPVHRGQCHRLE